jgi:hypothetical protein
VAEGLMNLQREEQTDQTRDVLSCDLKNPSPFQVSLNAFTRVLVDLVCLVSNFIIKYFDNLPQRALNVLERDGRANEPYLTLR